MIGVHAETATYEMIHWQPDAPRTDLVCYRHVCLSATEWTGKAHFRDLRYHRWSFSDAACFRATPVNQLERFEVRMCPSGYPVQLLGFKAKERRPSMLIDTEQSGIELLIKAGNVLLLQVSAGSSSPVFIAQMKKGTPTLISREDSVGGVSYREVQTNEGGFVVFTVPQKTRPDFRTGKFPDVPPHRIRLKMYDD